MRHIYLVGGGTAGHISPLEAVAEVLRQRCTALTEPCEIVYVGIIGGVHQPDSRYFDRVVLIRGGKFRRYANISPLKQLLDIKTQRQNVRDITQIMGGYADSRRELQRHVAAGDKAVVFTKGGYVGVPFAIAAARAGWPIITHDSDMVPGLANRLLRRYSPVRLIGWGSADNAETVGVPVHPRFAAARANRRAIRHEFGLNDEDRLVLVVGGSQGARMLDGAAERALSELVASTPTMRVCHIYGKLNEDAITTAYRELSEADRKRVLTVSLRPDIERYMAAADVVISRSGATALAEAAVIGCPLILVPGEQLTGSQQLLNGRFAEAHGAALLVRESPETSLPARLVDAVRHILADKTAAQRMAQRLHEMARTSATARIADIIIEHL